MKKKLFLASLFVLIGMFFSEKSFAQQVITETTFDSASTYILKLRDESQLVGKYLGRDSLNVIIKTASMPRVEVPISNVVSVSKVEAENFRHGKYWFPNPNATRYFFAPSAFCLKAGEGYYQNTYLFLNSFNVGLSDHFTLGGGIEFISTFTSVISGEGGPIFYLTPKVGFEVAPKVNVGAGLLYVSIPSFDGGQRGGGGIGYGLCTYGNSNNNITGGVGWGYSRKEVGSFPFFTISGMTRISRKTALITENWILTGEDNAAIYSYGFRFFGEKLAVDLGFVNNSDIAEALLIGIPYVDFVVKF